MFLGQFTRFKCELRRKTTEVEGFGLPPGFVVVPSLEGVGHLCKTCNTKDNKLIIENMYKIRSKKND